VVELADVKNDLPDWPDEVLEEWLVYLANRDDTGWPPPAPLEGSWAAILGGRPLSWWREVMWQKQSIDCSLNALAPKTHDIVTSMRAEIAAQQADAVTQRRFNHALYYILTEGAFPKPLIGLKVNNRLLVLDGNHRVAAFTAAQLFPEATLQAKGWHKVAPEQEVWIGTHRGGEAPLT
jgi:hypothetical protein